MSLLRIGTRGSRLALWQANDVKHRLESLHPGLAVTLVEITTQGDRIVDRPLAAIGGKGLFVKEIERALLDGTIDLAVHSAKDLPAEMPHGLVLAAALEREDPHDVLVSRDHLTLAELPHGARVGTSSLRRRAMLLAARPDLDIVDLRGNVPTRLRKVRDGEDGLVAAVLAYAGIHRLELDDAISERLELASMLPAAGQGIVAVQAREHDPETLRFLAALDDPRSRAALAAERATLSVLEGSCHIPLGVHAAVSADGATVEVQARLVAPDGTRRIEASVCGAAADARALGVTVGRALLEQGGQALLDTIRTGEPSHGSVLRGVPVIVTRSRAQASRLSALIEAHAGTPIEVPVLDVEPLDPTEARAALERLADGHYDWLILTSPNGVEHGLAGLTAEDLRIGTTRIAVVGQATAEQLFARTGVRADLVPAVHTSEGLLDALLAVGVGEGSHCLMLVAETTRGVIERGLETAGASVERVPVYRTHRSREGAPRLAEALRGEPRGWITFASSSAVDGLMALVDGDPEALEGWRVAVIGPVTADTARAHGLQVDVMPDTADLGALVAALVRAQSDGGAAPAAP